MVPGLAICTAMSIGIITEPGRMICFHNPGTQEAGARGLPFSNQIKPLEERGGRGEEAQIQ